MQMTKGERLVAEMLGDIPQKGTPVLTEYHPFLRKVIKFMESRREWQGTATELLKEIGDDFTPPNTVIKLLNRYDYDCFYKRDTENFKTTSKNYRSKKRVWNDKENRKLFEDTHPAIVDEITFNTVQEIRKHKRRPTATGKISIFSGKIFCADCGAKLHYNTSNYHKESQDCFVCSNYRSNTGSCTIHYIRGYAKQTCVQAYSRRSILYSAV